MTSSDERTRATFRFNSPVHFNLSEAIGRVKSFLDFCSGFDKPPDRGSSSNHRMYSGFLQGPRPQELHFHTGRSVASAQPNWRLRPRSHRSATTSNSLGRYPDPPHRAVPGHVSKLATTGCRVAGRPLYAGVGATANLGLAKEHVARRSPLKAEKWLCDGLGTLSEPHCRAEMPRRPKGLDQTAMHRLVKLVAVNRQRMGTR